MATPKYGVWVDWAKHLRPYGRRIHWKKVRKLVKNQIRKEQN
jgi:hypothetical protein